MNSTHRHAWLGAAASALLFLTGCGGGGGSGSTGTLGTASLAGHLVLRDGSTSNLGGVRFTFPRTGRTVTTASDGSFDFGTVPAGTLTIRLAGGTGLTTLREEESGGNGTDGPTDGVDGSGHGSDDGSSEDESGDDINDDNGNDAVDSDSHDDGDDHDTGDDDCDVTSVADGESIDISLSIDGGVITSVDVSRSGHDDCESEVRLQRSVESDDADVTGDVETESRTDRQRIKVEAEHLTAGRTVRAVVIAPDLTEADLGVVEVDLTGHARWEINTGDGDVLPFGVATVAELVGFGLEVRDATAGTVLLFGTMPDTPPTTDEDDDHSEGTRSRGRALLAAGAGAVGEAHVEIESRTGDEAREEFKVEVEHEVSGLTFDVYVEDPSAPGTFALVGTRTVDGEHEAELEIESHDGGTLPFGLTSVSGLVGMQVEVRNAAGGAVLYSGIVPALVAHD